MPKVTHPTPTSALFHSKRYPQQNRCTSLAVAELHAEEWEVITADIAKDGTPHPAFTGKLRGDEANLVSMLEALAISPRATVLVSTGYANIIEHLCRKNLWSAASVTLLKQMWPHSDGIERFYSEPSLLSRVFDECGVDPGFDPVTFTVSIPSAVYRGPAINVGDSVRAVFAAMLDQASPLWTPEDTSPGAGKVAIG